MYAKEVFHDRGQAPSLVWYQKAVRMSSGNFGAVETENLFKLQICNIDFLQKNTAVG
jgi:hypothetical protein